MTLMNSGTWISSKGDVELGAFAPCITLVDTRTLPHEVWLLAVGAPEERMTF